MDEKLRQAERAAAIGGLRERLELERMQARAGGESETPGGAPMPMHGLSLPGLAGACKRHEPVAEFHYEHNGIGFQAVALINVECKLCGEPIEYCSRCGGIYGVHVERWDTAGSLCRPGDPASYVCTGVGAGWCPVHGDCTCIGEEWGDELYNKNTPGCPLHDPDSLHAERVTEHDDPSRGRYGY